MDAPDTPAEGGTEGEIDWDLFPVESIGPATFLKRNLIHWNLLREARKRAGGGVLEVGVGSGAQSALLSRTLRPVVTLDNNLGILRTASGNLERYGKHVHRIAADAFQMPFADGTFGVAVSQGLMEHFADDQIRDLVAEQLRVCRSVVFSVPSLNYPRQDMGNERLMHPREWAAILARAVDARRYVVESRFYRGDLEALKYALLARKRLGSFSVLVTIDPR